ncbi:hypothetical protein POTOM_014447 [Populus tomentosa]|uniref:Uncharacterized protein n=1 Tax=Populus tomentosa TaxID=118781 RepID=A0A8X8CZC9_POPTO|nr:hypothetical protein POTOM_014447 [Populus tomentosa]
MPKTMKSPVTSAVFLATTLAFVGLIAINGSQARILPDSLGLEVATPPNYGGTYSPPPPSLIPSQRSKELTSNYEKYSSPPPPSPKAEPSIGQVTPSYGRTTASPPPPPKPASPKAQLEMGSQCSDGCISMITNLERPSPPPPPPPKPSPPSHPITFDLEPKVHAGSPPGQKVFST